ncbi:hypothetical protein [Janthinobacterium sp. MDT1-19]|uniref:hypothetical protein n=1 Tax=Janthinobacterium sp. MDT1-19 TaxID=1259339 RepID=UPI003F20F47B
MPLASLPVRVARTWSTPSAYQPAAERPRIEAGTNAPRSATARPVAMRAAQGGFTNHIDNAGQLAGARGAHLVNASNVSTVSGQPPHLYSVFSVG